MFMQSANPSIIDPRDDFGDQVGQLNLNVAADIAGGWSSSLSDIVRLELRLGSYLEERGYRLPIPFGRRIGCKQ